MVFWGQPAGFPESLQCECKLPVTRGIKACYIVLHKESQVKHRNKEAQVAYLLSDDEGVCCD